MQLQRASFEFEDLTEEQCRWVLMQHQVDRGLQWCARCDRFGWHTFCGKCGRRYLGGDLTWRECPRCKAQVSTDWCTLCGAPVYDEHLRRYLEGDPRFLAERNAFAKRMMAEQFPPSTPGGKPDLIAAIKEQFGGL